MSWLTSFFGKNKFNLISWLVTLIVAAGLIGGALAWLVFNGYSASTMAGTEATAVAPSLANAAPGAGSAS